MTSEISENRWFKSSSSSVTGCVEVAYLPGGRVGVRDSKNPSRQPHVVGRPAWRAFIAGVKNGEYDLPSQR
jgi:uncharacterized protein DUF397